MFSRERLVLLFLQTILLLFVKDKVYLLLVSMYINYCIFMCLCSKGSIHLGVYDSNKKSSKS